MPDLTTGDGVTLSYLDQGEVDRPPVLLLAGFTAPASSWLFQVPALLDAGYRVLSFDRRGHGASEDPVHGSRLARHAKDVEELLARLGLDDVAAVGGSMGASVIWAYVDLFGTTRLRGIVNIDQTPRMLNTEDWPYGFYGYTAEKQGTFFATGVPATGRGTPPEAKGPEVLARLLQASGVTPDQAAQPRTLSPQALALLRDHAEKDWRDVIERVDVPTLLVAAADSELWPAGHADAMAARNPEHVRSALLEHCGHAVNMEQPDAFNDLLLGFLGPL